MNKFRILTDGKYFRVQFRFMWIFWDYVYIIGSNGYEEAVTFNSKKEAEEYIESQVLKYGLGEWKKIK